MIAFFANLFGYLLNFLYNLIQNYGIAMILFSIIIKLILLPNSINQQKTMKKTAKIQEEMKIIQVKNKNNPEALQRETMELYKRENMSPFSGCFGAIIQIILLFSVLYLVRYPLTYMKKVDPEIINEYSEQINSQENDAYPEITIIREKAEEDDRVYINMEFLGLDLSNIPSRDFDDWRTYVIPALYVISTFISIKLTNSLQNKKKKSKNVKENDKDKDLVPVKTDESMEEIMAQANKNMTYMMPFLAISISLVAPLGLALYWLTNNVLMIIERLVLNRFIKDEEEA